MKVLNAFYLEDARTVDEDRPPATRPTPPPFKLTLVVPEPNPPPPSIASVLSARRADRFAAPALDANATLPPSAQPASPFPPPTQPSPGAGFGPRGLPPTAPAGSQPLIPATSPIVAGQFGSGAVNTPVGQGGPSLLPGEVNAHDDDSSGEEDKLRPKRKTSTTSEAPESPDSRSQEKKPKSHEGDLPATHLVLENVVEELIHDWLSQHATHWVQDPHNLSEFLMDVPRAIECLTSLLVRTCSPPSTLFRDFILIVISFVNADWRQSDFR